MHLRDTGIEGHRERSARGCAPAIAGINGLRVAILPTPATGLMVAVPAPAARSQGPVSARIPGIKAGLADNTVELGAGIARMAPRSRSRPHVPAGFRGPSWIMDFQPGADTLDVGGDLYLAHTTIGDIGPESLI